MIMNTEQQEFIRELIDKTDNHAAWLSIVKFGTESLLRHPDTLIELICLEAEREAKRFNDNKPFEEIPRILHELNLRIVPAD